MAIGEPITITIPAELSDRIRARIAEDGYADPLDVLEDGLDALEPDEQGLSHWLRTEVAAAVKDYQENPANVLTEDQLKTSLQTEYERFRKNG
jgi:Arc/MetJ-type ribon-helix-helix transcriptional regulator